MRLSMVGALLVLAGLSMSGWPVAGYAQEPLSTQRAPADAKTRFATAQSHLANGRPVLALVGAKRLCLFDKMVAACNLAGTILTENKGVAPDARQAAAMYEVACSLRDAEACIGLAYAHQYAGTEPDYVAVENAFKRACDLDDGKGCWEYGNFFFETNALEKAAAPAKKSCDLGYAQGCEAYASFLAEGIGIGKDEARAKIYYRKACELGHKASCALAK